MIEYFMLGGMVVGYVVILWQLLSIKDELKETKKILSDFLYQYHKYEGKK